MTRKQNKREAIAKLCERFAARDSRRSLVAAMLRRANRVIEMRKGLQ